MGAKDFLLDKKVYLNTKLLMDELDKVKNIDNTADAFDAICRISKIFENLSENDFKKIIYEKIHIIFIENIFSNPHFSEKLFKIIKDEKYSLDPDRVVELAKSHMINGKEINFEEKQYIQTTLYLAGFALANVFHLLSRTEVSILREKMIYKLECVQRNNSQYTITDICFSLYNSIYNFEYSFKKDILGQYDISKIFQYNKISRCIIGIMMLIIPEVNVFQIKFKKISKEKDESKLSITRGLCEIYSIAKKIISGIDYFYREYVKSNNSEYIINFTDFFFTNNERNILHIFKEISSDFHVQENKTFADVFLQKIDNSKKIREKISIFSKKNLKAFGNQESYGNEWSNKIFLISIKLLSTLEEIRDSLDIRWKVDVAIYELIKWIESVHKILNKYDIEDGWEKIEMLILQENSRVEWKSTFWTPTEELFISDETERKRSRSILLKIVEPMIGMMNTEGGTILVGLVENPEAIKREDVKRNLLIKNKLTFFDVNYEFDKKRKSLDNAKREIQDLLFSITLYTADKFNELWSIEPIEIKNNYSVATIYKIEVTKADNYIYKIKKEDDALWVTLIKRADGRTIKVDPREYLKK